MQKEINHISKELLNYNIEIEKAIMASIISDNNNIIKISKILNNNDFSKSSNQIIFSTMTEMLKTNEIITIESLINKLLLKEKLEKAGGELFLKDLLNEYKGSNNVADEAIRLVINNYIINIAELLNKMISTNNLSVTNNQDDIGSIIDSMERSLFETVYKTLKKPAFKHIKNIIGYQLKLIREQQTEDPRLDGILSGFNSLDNITGGFKKSDLIILASRPTVGKTSFALNIIRNMGIKQDIPIAIFSFKESAFNFSMHLASLEAGLSTNVNHNLQDKNVRVKLCNAGDIVTKAPIFIQDNSNISTLGIISTARELKMEYGIQIIIIDYLQLIKHFQSKKQFPHIMQSLKDLSLQLDCPVIVLSQLNNHIDYRENKRPVLSDLEGIEKYADMVLFIYRDEVYKKLDENDPGKGKTEIIVAKNNEGPNGVCYLKYNSDYSSFEDFVL